MRGTVWTKVVNIKVHCINKRITFKLIQQRFFLTYPWLSYLRNRTRSIWAGSGTSVCRRENPLLPERHCLGQPVLGTATRSHLAPCNSFSALLQSCYMMVILSCDLLKSLLWHRWKRQAKATVMFLLHLLHSHLWIEDMQRFPQQEMMWVSDVTDVTESFCFCHFHCCLPFQ